MGFTSGDEETEDRLPDITAVISNIGVDYRKYDNGNDENRLVVIWEPEGGVFSKQTETLSTYNILKVNDSPSIIHVGGEENGFDLNILGDVIFDGKLGYKASLWMKKLEELGVKIPSETGNLRELIGVKAVLRHMTFNEAKGRERGEREKPFWIPIEVIPPQTKAPIEASAEVEVTTKPEKSLHDAVLEVAPTMSEKELVEWYMKSVYIGSDESVVPVFMVLEELEKENLLKWQNGTYVRLGGVAPSGEVEGV